MQSNTNQQKENSNERKNSKCNGIKIIMHVLNTLNTTIYQMQIQSNNDLVGLVDARVKVFSDELDHSSEAINANK